MSKYSIESHLFITLFWLKNYPTNYLLSIIFCIDQLTLSRIIKKTLICLDLSLNFLIKWPTDQMFLDLNENFKNFYDEDIYNVPCVVDGSEIRIYKPQKKLQHLYYSVKKNNIP